LRSDVDDEEDSQINNLRYSYVNIRAASLQTINSSPDVSRIVGIQLVAAGAVAQVANLRSDVDEEEIRKLTICATAMLISVPHHFRQSTALLTQ